MRVYGICSNCPSMASSFCFRFYSFFFANQRKFTAAVYIRPSLRGPVTRYRVQNVSFTRLCCGGKGRWWMGRWISADRLGAGNQWMCGGVCVYHTYVCVYTYIYVKDWGEWGWYLHGIRIKGRARWAEINVQPSERKTTTSFPSPPSLGMGWRAAATSLPVSSADK